MLYLVATYLLTILFYSLLLSISLVIFGRLWFEPRIGVCKCKTKLDGKVAIVTGGSSGIGLETARDLASRGARVIIACRNAKKAEAVVEDIVQTTGNPKVEFRHLDLFKPSSIREFAADFNKTVDRSDILVNNAGCAGVKYRLSENGVDIVMQVNHIGPFLLTKLLMDKIIASKPSRIVIVSSKMHYVAKLDLKDLAGMKDPGHYIRYANSKICNVLWAKALARRLPTGVTVNSLHPGFVNTNIFRHLGSVTVKMIEIITTMLFKTSKQGAQTTIHLCVAPELENCSGGYYSDCKLQSYYKIAQDDDLEEKVWMESVRLSGM